MRTITVNVVYPKGDQGDTSIVSFQIKGVVAEISDLLVTASPGDAYYVENGGGVGVGRWFVWITEPHNGSNWYEMTDWTLDPSELWTDDGGELKPGIGLTVNADILTGELSGGIFQP